MKCKDNHNEWVVLSNVWAENPHEAVEGYSNLKALKMETSGIFYRKLSVTKKASHCVAFSIIERELSEF
ncbi:MAG: hypothetical protein C5B52_17105 [Bacteroidetes bacterium]|nr:MAG: hypothetical protein C5B52_17105 [Bacteroidota bacterium]